jgi:hypothetical protein
MMFKKILLAGVFALATAVGAFAADTLAMSLNFYSDNGKIAPVGDFPAGVLMGKPVKFANKKLKGYAWPVTVEIDRAPSIELTFKIKGSGELVVSLNPEIWVSGKGIVSRMTVKCTEFVLDGRPNKKVPFTFSKWTKASRGIMVEDGDVITVKATFEKVK